MPFAEASIRSLAHLARERNLVILAGAGISFAPPASAPLFRPLRDMLLQALAQSLDAELSPAEQEEFRDLFNASKFPRAPQEPPPEVLFEACHGCLGEPLFDLLRTLLDSPEPNTQHEFVALLFGTHLPLLITTNFERCFEIAIQQAGRQARVCASGSTIAESMPGLLARDSGTAALIWKPHGTLDRGQEDTIRVTLSQVRGEIRDRDKTDSLLKVFSVLPTLVIGYSGYDADIAQALRMAGRAGGQLFWLARTEPRAGEPCTAILAEYGERGQLLTGNLSELFTALGASLGLPFVPPPEASIGDTTLHDRCTGLAPILNTISLPRRFLALGVLLQSLGRFEKALEIYERGAQMSAASKDGVFFAVAVTMRHQLLRDLGRVEQSQDALALLENAPWVQLLRAQQAAAQQDFKGAAELFEKTRESPVAQDLHANILHSEGIVLCHKGQWAEARRKFEESLKISTANGDLNLETATRHELGIVAITTGNFKGAQKIFSELRDDARQLGRGENEMAAIYELGLIASNHTQQFAEGRRQFLEALQLAIDFKSPLRVVHCLFGLADTDLSEGTHRKDLAQIKRAEQGFGKAAEAAAEIKDHLTEATALARRARCRLIRGEMPEAIADLTGARSIAIKQGLDALLVGEITPMWNFLQSNQ